MKINPLAKTRKHKTIITGFKDNSLKYEAQLKPNTYSKNLFKKNKVNDELKELKK